MEGNVNIYRSTPQLDNKNNNDQEPAPQTYIKYDIEDAVIKIPP